MKAGSEGPCLREYTPRGAEVVSSTENERMSGGTVRESVGERRMREMIMIERMREIKKLERMREISRRAICDDYKWAIFRNVRIGWLFR